MASSLRELLAEEALLRRRKAQTTAGSGECSSLLHPSDPTTTSASAVAGIFSCHDRRSVDQLSGVPRRKIDHRRTRSGGSSLGLHSSFSKPATTNYSYTTASTRLATSHDPWVPRSHARKENDNSGDLAVRGALQSPWSGKASLPTSPCSAINRKDTLISTPPLPSTCRRPGSRSHHHHQRTPSHVLENALYGSPAAVQPHTPRKIASIGRLFTCRTELDAKGSGGPSRIQGRTTPRLNSPAATNSTTTRALRKPTAGHAPSTTTNSISNLRSAITAVSGASTSLTECEAAVRIIGRAWSACRDAGKPATALEPATSRVVVIEGVLEVCSASRDDQILDIAMSILAEAVTRSEVNRHVILNADPQLETFMRLLRNRRLYLKAAVLLHLLRPKAKQMLAADWVPSVLRVLEHGDQQVDMRPLVKFSRLGSCSPGSAALYLLDQLLSGFDVDRNAENAKQMVGLEGLKLLIRWLDVGELRERSTVASLLTACIAADGSCREYLAINIAKASLVEILGDRLKSNTYAIPLITELLCLSRRAQVARFLVGLRTEGCLNAMQILLVYIVRASPEHRPLAAAILLQLDLLGDPSQYSIYTEEAIDALVKGLDCSNNRKVQEQSSRALLVLAGRFSEEGVSLAESWLLKRAGLDDSTQTMLHNRATAMDDDKSAVDEEDVITENWLGVVMSVLLRRGSRSLITALSNGIANGSPCLARSCLVTIAWVSSSLCTSQTTSGLSALACSTLIMRLKGSLNYNRALEERVLASFVLFNITRCSECLPKLLPLTKDVAYMLQDLAQYTWTAKEILCLNKSFTIL